MAVAISRVTPAVVQRLRTGSGTALCRFIHFSQYLVSAAPAVARESGRHGAYVGADRLPDYSA